MWLPVNRLARTKILEMCRSHGLPFIVVDQNCVPTGFIFRPHRGENGMQWSVEGLEQAQDLAEVELILNNYGR